MPTPVTESSEGGQHVEWSETFHAFLFRARIYLRRFWWILIVTVVGGVVLQKWKLRDAQPSYQSHASMMVSGTATASTGAAAGYSENYANYFQTNIYVLQSEELIKTAKNNVVAAESRYLNYHPWVQASADLLPNTSVLNLTATGGDKQFTQLFLDAWMDAFLRKKRDMRDNAIKDFDLSLNQTAIDYQADETKVGKALDKFLADNQIASVEAAEEAAREAENNYRAISAQESNLNRQLIPLGGQLPTLDSPPPSAEKPASADTKLPGSVSNMDTFKKYIAGDDADSLDLVLATYGLLPPDPAYEGKKELKMQLQAKYDQLAVGLGANHPKMENLQSLIDSVDKGLVALRRLRVAQLERIKANILSTLQLLEVQKADYELKNNQYLAIMQKIKDFNSDIKRDNDRYLAFIQGSNALKETRSMDTDMLRIFSQASEPITLMPDQMKQMSQGAFVGLAAGIVIIFLLGVLDGRVMSVEDLTQRFDEPMLGVIPMQKRTNGQVELLKHNDQRQMFAEACRNIRSSLLYMDRQGQRPRVIMLTSSMPSEGKSTLSSNLAITLGFAASRTLLVDADMRRGQLHKRFGLKNDVGLAEHIEKGVPLDQVIQSTGSENLDFIPCGQYPVQPGELLMSERFRESIQTLRQRYDFVVFDSPPILLTDDAASFATRADAVLFVVRAGFTRLRQVRTSVESLHRRGVNVYGMVINFIDHREPGYYSYRYYDYYAYRADRPESAKAK